MDNQGHAYSDYPNPLWRRLAIGALVLVVVVGIGFLSWYLLHKSSNDKPQSPPAQQPAVVADNKISTETKHYDSPNLYLGIDYPKDWTVTDNGGGEMAITSPAIALKDTTDQTVSGQIVLRIRTSTDKLAEFDGGNALATRNSLKIAYSKPTQSQRGNTYLSFLRYANSSSGALDGIYITGDFGYKKDQAIPKIDIAKINPIINITFTKCADANCSGKSLPLPIADSSWSDADFAGPLQKMLQSLSIT